MDDALDVGRVHTADAHSLDILTLLVCPVEVAQNFPDTVHTNDLLGVLLSLSSVEGANSKIVSASLHGYPSLLDRRDRGANDLVVSKDASCFDNVHVILAKMDTLAAHGECNIDPVINKEGDVVLLAFFVQLFCCRDQGACVTGLVSVLDDSHT